MILTFDRDARTITGGGITTAVDHDGDAWPYWCRDARAAGIELQGLVLEVWDRGCNLGKHLRITPLHCFTVTIRRAHKLRLPPFPAPKKEAS